MDNEKRLKDFDIDFDFHNQEPKIVARQRRQKEPKNNDGRERCYWCGAPTKSMMMFTSIGDVCTECGE